MTTPPKYRIYRPSLAALLCTATALYTPAMGAASSAAQPPASGPEEEIVVVGQRLIPDIAPERELTEQTIAAYGASTVEDLILELRSELDTDDDDPIYLVNGERVHDLDDIGAYPVEALSRVEVLPRGSATRVGGSTGQRVFSLNLRRQLRQATVTVASRLATEGDWGAARAETAFTRIQGPSRLNVTLRVRDEQRLLESDRGIVQPDQRLPYSGSGAALAYPVAGEEIDPALTAQAGRLITVAPVPEGSSPTLTDFAAGADAVDATDLGQFRTLRPDSRNFDLSASYSNRLAPWLTASANVRLNHSRSQSLSGLPSQLFLLEADHPNSPFSKDVGLAHYGEDPLRSRFQRSSSSGSLTFNATRATWRASLNLRHSNSSSRSRSERPLGTGAILVDDTVNPFATDLASLSPMRANRYSSLTRTSSGQLTVHGSPVRLPAGPLATTFEGRLSSSRLKASSDFSGDVRRGRTERAFRGLVELPIASARNGVLAPLGELSINGEYGRLHSSKTRWLDRHGYGLSWEPRPFLRLRASVEKSEQAPDLETLGDPVVFTPAVRTLDLLSGETVDVLQISGGNPLLSAARTATKRLSAIARLVPSLGLQLNAEYSRTDERNLISSLPPTSLAVMQAFPDRFVRDAEGRLITIDVRPVNFTGREQERLRYGFSLNSPLGAAKRVGRKAASASETDSGDTSADDTGDREDAAPAAASGPRTRLQLSLNHSLLLTEQISIRAGLPTVDLLEGGAIGLGGGRVRHQVDGVVGISSGGLGARITANWRGASTLESRVGGAPDLLRFSPLLLVNLRAFADAARIAPQQAWAKGMRLSLNVLNVASDRQEVRDSAGNTPIQYQKGYRDPLGRTIELELRKVF